MVQHHGGSDDGDNNDINTCVIEDNDGIGDGCDEK